MDGRSKNKGYSLVEMIIVIAIIGVVSGMALASVSMIHSAKAKDASVVFNAEVSELMAKAKSMNDSSAMYAIRIHRDGNNYYIQSGTVKKSGTDYMFKISPDNDNDYKGKSISKYVRVSYTEENSTGINYPADWNAWCDLTWTDSTNIKSDGSIGPYSDNQELSGVLIAVTKSGDVISGNGAYCFFKKNGSQVARVYVRKNGSHEAR